MISEAGRSNRIVQVVHGTTLDKSKTYTGHGVHNQFIYIYIYIYIYTNIDKPTCIVHLYEIWEYMNENIFHIKQLD